MAGVKPADRCPGVIRGHRAADGMLIRVRLPGGRTTAETLWALSRLAERFGNPELQLTSRAGIQLRGLPDPLPGTLVRSIEALGLLPSPQHDRVRNIVASPLTGIWGGRADVGGLIGRLDRGLIADPALAQLPGRFLFALDDGRGDVVSRPFDLGYRALDTGSGLLLVGAADLGFPISVDRVVPRLLELARNFTDARRESGAWHVRDLRAWRAELPGLRVVAAPAPGPLLPLGVIGGVASVAVPLGRLTPSQVEAVRQVAAGPVIITPWRGLILPGAAPALPRLTGAGLVADSDSPWSLLSACVGAPGCASARGSTRELAHALVGAGQLRTRTHLSGCERRCGAPEGPYLDLLADDDPAGNGGVLVGPARARVR